MRKVIDLRRPLGSVPIEDIELTAKSRDDIPAVLIGLQAIYRNKATREELFRLLDKRVLPDRRRDTGRLGMELWAILVMGVLKHGLNCDYDRLHWLVNKEVDVQRFLGHSPGVADGEYELQTIRDNVELMTPELLREVSQLVAATGHKVLGNKAHRIDIGRHSDSLPRVSRCRHSGTSVPEMTECEAAIRRRNAVWRKAGIPPGWVTLDSVDLDRFHTRPEIARDCLRSLLDAMRADGTDPHDYQFVEPSAGAGAFYDLLPAGRRTGIEIVPGRAEFECCDFLTWVPPANCLPYAVVGNPPFGDRAWLALKFVNHAATFADWIGMILPMAFKSSGKGSPKFRVRGAGPIHSEELPADSFVGVGGERKQVNAVWQVWRRGAPNPRPSASCTEWVDLFAIDPRPHRRCGHRRMKEADWFLQRTFYGQPPDLVRTFDEVRYRDAYGIAIRKDKPGVTAALRNADWNRHSLRAAHNCRHIGMEHIRAALTEAGFDDG